MLTQVRVNTKSQIDNINKKKKKKAWDSNLLNQIFNLLFKFIWQKNNVNMFFFLTNNANKIVLFAGLLVTIMLFLVFRINDENKYLLDECSPKLNISSMAQ